MSGVDAMKCQEPINMVKFLDMNNTIYNTFAVYLLYNSKFLTLKNL